MVPSRVSTRITNVSVCDWLIPYDWRLQIQKCEPTGAKKQSRVTRDLVSGRAGRKSGRNR